MFVDVGLVIHTSRITSCTSDTTSAWPLRLDDVRSPRLAHLWVCSVRRLARRQLIRCDRTHERAELVDLDLDGIAVTQKAPLGSAQPAGVPVAIMSPGNRVIVRESHAMRSAAPKIRLAVVPCCSTSPLIRARSSSAPRSPISSRVTSAGPQGANVSIAFPLVHSGFWNWRSRAVTSLKGIAPARQERRVLRRHVPCGATDHECQLRLVVDELGVRGGQDDLLAAANERVGELGDHIGAAGISWPVSSAWSR